MIFFVSNVEDSAKLETKYEDVKTQVALVDNQLGKLNSEIKMYSNIKVTFLLYRGVYSTWLTLLKGLGWN